MAGLFILMLFVVLAQYWYVAAGTLALWLLWWLVVEPARQQAAKEARERERHERARRQIDAVAAASARAMAEAARRHS
jgi:hypothetical protein